MMKEMDPQEYIHILFLCHNNLRSWVNYYTKKMPDFQRKKTSSSDLQSDLHAKTRLQTYQRWSSPWKKISRWWSFKSLRMVDLHEFTSKNTSKYHPNKYRVWNITWNFARIQWNFKKTFFELSPRICWGNDSQFNDCGSSAKFFWRVSGPPNFCPPWQNKKRRWYPMVPFFPLSPSPWPEVVLRISIICYIVCIIRIINNIFIIFVFLNEGCLTVNHEVLIS